MSRLAKYIFRPNVAGDGPNSAQAPSNLDALFRDYLPDRQQVEIIDVIKDPLEA